MNYGPHGSAMRHLATLIELSRLVSGGTKAAL
jgi:hypothetical protein